MYIKVSPQEIAETKKQHFLEKQNLKIIESESDYRINNPVLIKQRDLVRRLKDKIIMAEAYEEYPFFSKQKCAFNISEYCEQNINHTFYQWFIYGNCCKECSRAINSFSAKVEEEPISYTRKSAWDDIEELFSMSDSKDFDI